MSDPEFKTPWLIRMHHRMRTASFAMVFVATSLHLEGKGYGTAVWVYLVGLLLVYPHLQYWRSLRAKDSVNTEMKNLLIDSALLGTFISVIGFSAWLSFSVMLGTLTNNAANKGWHGMRQSMGALLAGVLVGVGIVGFRFFPETDWRATLLCIVGLGGYLLAMNNIGFSRNLQLRQTRKQLEIREQELLSANQALQENLREIDGLREQLHEQANRDPLTGLYNRRFLDTTLARELARCSREGKPLSMLMIDVDYFKRYNDHYGHQAGDECLKSVARSLQTCARRASDLAARYGGEEFSIVLADTDAAIAVHLAEEVRQAIESLNMPHEMSRAGRLTISVGVATMASHASRDMDALLRAADEALYRAKHSGRNQVRVAAEVPPQVNAGKSPAGDPGQLVWRPTYECGHAAIDEPHRDLFALGNIVCEAIAAGGSQDEMAELIENLIQEIAQHFGEEEAIIAAAGFPGTADHAANHRELLDCGASLVAGFRTGANDIDEAFHFLAHDVVARHMQEADRAFLPYLQTDEGVASTTHGIGALAR
jgi:diguanylate cyclase (GGDEF)-like protein/hemerythrin-like metal-binding protein